MLFLFVWLHEASIPNRAIFHLIKLKFAIYDFSVILAKTKCQESRNGNNVAQRNPGWILLENYI